MMAKEDSWIYSDIGLAIMHPIALDVKYSLLVIFDLTWKLSLEIAASKKQPVSIKP